MFLQIRTKNLRFRDTEGKEKIYEPIPRKNAHKEGEYSEKNSYLNTELYKSGVENTESHKAVLKKDIDRFLPHADSYDALISMLESVGYKVSAKTKDGGWRAHITFKLEGWQKGIRDSSLGEDYERRHITEVISSRKMEPIPKKNEADKVQSEIDKLLIQDNQRLNQELTEHLKTAMRPQKDARVAESNNKRTQYFIDRINGGLRTLKFVEDNNIHTIQQMNDAVRSMSEKTAQIYENAKAIKAAILIANKEAERIHRYNSLKASIEANASDFAGNQEYMLIEYRSDMAVLKALEATLKEHKLLLPEQQQEFETKLNEYTHRYEVMMKALVKVNNQISTYDDAIYNLTMMNQRMDGRYDKELQAYRNMKDEFKVKNKGQIKDENIIE